MRLKKRWQFGRFILSFFAILLPFMSLMPLASAMADVSPWLVNTLPSMDKLADLSTDEVNTLVSRVNTDCQKREVITRPAIPLVQNKVSQTGCVTDTAYGALYNGTYLQRPGSTIFGNVLENFGGQALLIPIPYSSTGLLLSGGNSSGSYMWFISNLDMSLSSSVITNGEVTHKLPAAPYTSSLHDASGRLLAIQANTVSFSANGNWMVVDVPNVATVRVNLNTFEVLPFGNGINYNIGIGPSLRTAISPDGRYAVVASKTFDVFKLYDLSTCGAVPGIITTNVPCQARDLLPYVKQKVANFSSVFRMRFRSDYSLDVFANSIQNGALVTSQYTMLAAGQSATNYDYLALGDSFASGEGAYQYKAATDIATNKCHLSQRSYPYLISAALNYGQHESVACSGAKINDLMHFYPDYKDKYSQAKGKADPGYNEEILNDFLPGYREQIDFINRYQPSIITLSAGGNDIGFADKIKRCLDTDTCYDSYEDRLEIVREINAQFYRLTDMYNQIKAANDPLAKVYIIGYPQIAASNGNCALNVHLNNDEIIFSQQLISYLNSVIKTAAANAGVAYVDVEDAFNGHKFCETDSWNVAVNGLTAGSDQVNIPLIHGPIGNESFHPNAFGHELLMTKILAATSNFTAPMPAPNDSLAVQDKTDGLALLNAPKTNRAIRLIKNYTGLDGGIMEYGKTWSQRLQGITPFIKAKSAVQVWLNSDPVSLGSFSVDTDGNLDISTTIPASVPAGFHTLHVYGKNTSNEDVDLYAVVYVGASPTDFDGDGADNTANPCLIVPLSGTDTDKDGVDDACDGFIGQAPPAPLPVEPEPKPTPIPDPAPDPAPSQPPTVPPVPIPDPTPVLPPDPAVTITSPPDPPSAPPIVTPVLPTDGTAPSVSPPTEASTLPTAAPPNPNGTSAIQQPQPSSPGPQSVAQPVSGQLAATVISLPAERSAVLADSTVAEEPAAIAPPPQKKLAPAAITTSPAAVKNKTPWQYLLGLLNLLALAFSLWKHKSHKDTKV